MDLDRQTAASPRRDSPVPHIDERILRCRDRRHPVDDCATIRLINMALDVPGRIVDLSLGGCRIRTQTRFPVGIYRRVEAEFRIQGRPFRIAGVTQAIYDPFNVGIRFLDVSDRKREDLRELIDEIEQGAARGGTGGDDLRL